MKRHIGVEIAKDQKTTKIALGPEMKEYFDELTKGKNHDDYIKEFLITAFLAKPIQFPQLRFQKLKICTSWYLEYHL